MTGGPRSQVPSKSRRAARPARATRRERIAAVIAALEAQMRALKSLGLSESASLVHMAWLDLKCRSERISGEELQRFCERILPEG